LDKLHFAHGPATGHGVQISGLDMTVLTPG
jgi:hypothetical protein